MQEDAEEPGTAYLAGQGPPINDEDDPDEYEGEDQPESEDFEEGEDDGAEGETTAGAPRQEGRRLGFFVGPMLLACRRMGCCCLRD